MIIPKQFTIFGQTIKVTEVDVIDSADSCGEYLHSSNEIRLKKDLLDDIKEQTFIHEVTHCILTNLSYFTLNENEKFVDRFAMGLHQILKTQK